MAIASSGAFTGVAAVGYRGLLVVLSSGDFTGDELLLRSIDRFVVVAGDRLRSMRCRSLDASME